MNVKELFINFDTGQLVDADGALVTNWPTLSYGAVPTWKLRFIRVLNGTISQVDMSEIVSAHAAVDVDFDSATDPMVRTVDTGIDKSQSLSGIFSVELDTNTQSFYNKINRKQSLGAFFEFRGLDSDAKVIFDYKFRVTCLGVIDIDGATPLPVTSGLYSLTDVYAILRAAQEFRFSADGVNWHSEQQNADVYYQSRYPEGSWSDSIELHNGQDGEDGQDAANVKFQYSTNNSSWHDTPAQEDCWFRTSNDDGLTWTDGLLFRNATVNSSNVIGLSDAIINVTSALYDTKDEISGMLDEKADKTIVANLGSIGGQFDFDIAEGDYQTLTLNGDLTLNSFTGFSTGDAAALQVTKNSGSTLYYDGAALIPSTDAGTFLIGLICVAENIIKVTAATNLY